MEETCWRWSDLMGDGWRLMSHHKEIIITLFEIYYILIQNSLALHFFIQTLPKENLEPKLIFPLSSPRPHILLSYKYTHFFHSPFYTLKTKQNTYKVSFGFFFNFKEFIISIHFLQASRVTFSSSTHLSSSISFTWWVMLCFSICCP